MIEIDISFYVEQHKKHEELKLSTDQRNAFWKSYMEDLIEEAVTDDEVARALYIARNAAFENGRRETSYSMNTF